MVSPPPPLPFPVLLHPLLHLLITHIFIEGLMDQGGDDQNIHPPFYDFPLLKREKDNHGQYEGQKEVTEKTTGRTLRNQLLKE